MTEEQKRYLLLQVNDALFPIGAYSHSYGLETYIQKRLVKDESSAAEFIHHMLLYSLCQNELMAACMAYDRAAEEDYRGIWQLENLVSAGKTAMEVRRAGERLGSRFVKTIVSLDIIFETGAFLTYSGMDMVKSHIVAYGVFCAAAGIKKELMLEHYLYGQTSVMVTNCVKTVPLSQTAGQRLLFGCIEVYEKVFSRLDQLKPEDFGASAPGFELRCIQHERLYSRLYMS